MLFTTRHQWDYSITLVVAGTTSIREHCTGNIPSRRPTRWVFLRILQRQIFPGVRLDETRPGLPISVDSHTIIFVTTPSILASTPVEVCCFSVLKDAVFMSTLVDIALMYNETEDCVSSFRQLITTTIGCYDFVIPEHQPLHRRR